MQNDKKFGKGTIVNRDMGIVSGKVNDEKVYLEVTGGIFPNTLYVTVLKEPLENGIIKVGCHFGGGRAPMTSEAVILPNYIDNSRGK